jgi:hypothetical protein
MLKLTKKLLNTKMTKFLNHKIKVKTYHKNKSVKWKLKGGTIYLTIEF